MVGDFLIRNLSTPTTITTTRHLPRRCYALIPTDVKQN